jgi:hypothetical protein
MLFPLKNVYIEKVAYFPPLLITLQMDAIFDTSLNIIRRKDYDIHGGGGYKYKHYVSY